MNPEQSLEIAEEYSEDTGLNVAGSVEDFFRELEAKEKDLDISPGLVIEVERSEYDERNVPDFVLEDLDRAEPRPAASLKEPSHAEDLSQRAQIARLEQSIQQFKNERTEILERSKRQLDDFDNFRRRVERDRLETYSAQMTNLAVQMLPVLDNLNRAMDAASAMPEDKRSEFEEFINGVVLVNQQVAEVLAGMGVEPIPAIGREFDPQFHEAVATDDSGDGEPNSITEEMLRGYRIGERVIRHSLVKVAAARHNVSNS